MAINGGSVLDQPLVFVDIETNGLNHVRGRVIEVAAIRVEAGKITAEFSSLIDPQSELPSFITNLTGISRHDLVGAPTFDQIADDLAAVLDGAIFVAHNVRFDYSFLKQEFKRLGRNFLPKQLCTVKLSRALYPQERSHKLQSLIERHNFGYTNRHRAYDDAAVLWQFVQHVQQHFSAEQVAMALAKQLSSPTIPKALEPALVKGLPEAPGVYIFEDAQGRALYVGKSVNIKRRVMDHFGRDHAESKEFKIAQTVKNIRTEQTSGELTALLRESQLVKELQPLYNRQLRRLSKLLLVKRQLNAAGYMTVQLEEASSIDPAETSAILAVYPRRGRAKQSLETITKTFDLCPKLMGLEKTDGACFLRQLHKCRGACEQAEPAALYNQRLMTAFENQRIHDWPYKGAILLEEQWMPESTHGLIIDNWCVIGELQQQPYCEPVIRTSDRQFDLDTYKILQSHLRRKLATITIRPLERHVLTEWGMA